MGVLWSGLNRIVWFKPAVTRLRDSCHHKLKNRHVTLSPQGVRGLTPVLGGTYGPSLEGFQPVRVADSRVSGRGKPAAR